MNRSSIATRRTSSGRCDEAGFEISVSTNGSILDEKRGTALLEAGLKGIEINVGEEGGDYDQIYGLPFEKTCDNVVRFAEMAERSRRRVPRAHRARQPST